MKQLRDKVPKGSDAARGIRYEENSSSLQLTPSDDRIQDQSSPDLLSG
jgi:hypothetical protein